MIIMEAFEHRICSCFYNTTMYCLYNRYNNDSSLCCSECRPDVCANEMKSRPVLIRTDRSVLPIVAKATA